MEGEMDLSQEAKWKGREDQELDQAFLRVLQCMGIKSEAGIFKREGMIIILIEVASESTFSLTRMPT